MRTSGNNALKEGRDWKTNNRYEDVMRQDAAGRLLKEQTEEAPRRGPLAQAACGLAQAVKVLFLVAALAAALWILASVVDVDMHNNPFEDDGEPHSWNAFVVMTDGWR